MKIFQLIDWLTKLFKLNNRSKIILLILLPLPIFSQNNAFWLGKRTAGTPTNLLLDDYPGAAAAYSVRKLDKDYTGFAMEIRRASDNATQNIGFVGEDLDEVAINSFCSGTDCFVKTWYDQSGNGRDATQTTALNQPKIYDSATGIITENGKSAINFDGSNNYLTTSTSVSFSNNWHNIVYKFNNVNAYNYAFSISASSISNVRQNLAKTITNKIYFYDGIGIKENGNTSNSLELSQIQFITSSPFVRHYLNGSSAVSVLSPSYANNSSATGKIVIGALDYSFIANYMSGRISELVVYNADISSDRININNNINSYYSIY